MRVQDLDAKNSVASSDELIITDSSHKSWRTTFANFIASITSLANLAISTLFQVTGDTQLADTTITGDVGITGDTDISGDLDVTGDVSIAGGLEVTGDIIQHGSAYETHAQKVYTKDDVINLRDGAIAGLAAGEYAGLIAKHYDADGNDGALVFNRSGEARVGDYTVSNVTVYSSDGIAFYTDAEMTEPATIPAGVTPTLVSGTEYTYTAITDDTEPLLTRDEIANMTDKAIAVWDATAKKVKAGPVPAVANKVLISQADGSFVWGDYTAGSDMIEASSVTITGRALISGVIIRVMFMSDLAGVDTSTGLVINYNSVNYNVKVAKDGSLVNFVASDLGGSPTVYKYLQAYTAFELLFDGTQFIIVGNPVVLSGSGFKVYADGSKLVDEVTLNNMQSVTSNAVARVNTWIDVTSTWVASAKSGFNNTNFNYKVVKRYNIDNTYTYRITALSPYLSESTAYIRFSALQRSVFGFNTEGSAQTSDGTVICTRTGFANTRNDRGSSNVNTNIAFFSDRLELQFSSYASDRSNQGLCTWELTVNKDLDTYFA